MTDQQFVLFYDLMARLVAALERQATTSRETAEASKEKASVYDGDVPSPRSSEQQITSETEPGPASKKEKRRDMDMVEGFVADVSGGMGKKITSGITGTMLDLLKNETAAGNVIDVLAMRKEAREESFRLAKEWGTAGRPMSNDEAQMIVTGRKRIADIKMGNIMNIRSQLQDPISGFGQEAVGSAIDSSWQYIKSLFQVNQNNKMQGK